MTVPILQDEDIASLVPMDEAIAAVEAAFARKAEGRFITPPRHYVRTKSGALAFTIGGDDDEGVVGFRVYPTFSSGGPPATAGSASGKEQLVVVYDSATGDLKGIVLGSLLGEVRTGAIGGVAIKYAAREDARTLGLIGSGRQARTQLAAAATVRDLESVRVYSRSRQRRESFAAEMTERLGLPIAPVASPEEAVRDADIVVAATNSGSVLFDASLIAPGAHVTTVGPKFRDAHELDLAFADRAASVFTDSPEQVRDYAVPFFLAHTPHIKRMTDLASHVAGAPLRRSDDDITLFCSVGLAGTEVVVADVALGKRARTAS